MNKYSYIVLKFVPDAVRSEAINVGLFVFSKQNNFARFKIRSNLVELKKVFPDIQVTPLRRYLEIIGSKIVSQITYDKMSFFDESAKKYALNILPSDFSGLRWDDEKSGLSENIEKTFENLLKRLVNNSLPKAQTKKEDEDVWQSFMPALSRTNFFDQIIEKKIQVEGFDLRFDHAFKNGRWHCMIPMTMDYVSKENMMDRVQKEIGRVSIVQQAKDESQYEFYFLVGTPSREDLVSGYDKVTNILNTVKHAHVISEDRPEELVQYIEAAIQAH